MPQRYVMQNGRITLVGEDTADDHQPPAEAAQAPPRPAAKPPKRPAKPAAPWWKNPLHAAMNEVRWAGKQMASLQRTQKPDGILRGGLIDAGLMAVGSPFGLGAAAVAARRSPVVRQIQAASSFGAAQTAGEGIIALGQKVLAPTQFADARRSPPGRALDAMTRAGYGILGAKRPEDLTEGQRGVIDFQARGVGIELASTLIPVARVSRGTGWAARGLNWGTKLGVMHGLGALLQDSTQGNISNIAEALTGAKVPLAVDPAKDDRVTAALKSVIPNMLGGEAVGFVASGGARVVGRLANTARWRRAARASQEHVTANQKLEATGLVETIEGRQRFTEAAAQRPAPVIDSVDQATQELLNRYGWTRQGQAIQSPQPPVDPSSPTIRSTGPTESWRQAGAPQAPASADPSAIRAVPEWSPVQDRLRQMEADPWRRSLTPDESLGALDASDVQRALGLRYLQENPEALRALEAGPGAMGAQPLLRDLESAPFTVSGPLVGREAPMMEPPPINASERRRVFEQGRAASAAGRDLQPPAAATDVDFGGPVKPGELPTADPAIDPWWDDAGKPEVADVQKLLSDLDPDELTAVAVAGADGGPVLKQLEQVIAARPPAQPRPEVSEAIGAAPTSRLSSLYMKGAGSLEAWDQQIEALPTTRLQELAHPEASPLLAERITTDTGRSWEAFTREDILDGMRALSAEGNTILPNRIRGDAKVLPTDQIQAAPREFQYKEGVNAQGEQLGQSLGGVERWDPNSEGVLQVFTDPRDGVVKVVNGHNRLALAKRLGIPSLRVEEVNASTPAGARAAGAIANISDGNGTPFDAAKFIRETGLSTPEELRAAGIPLEKGWGRQGLALSKLPGDILQEAINGEHRLGRYVALGESGLDEAGIRGAYQVLKQRPKMTEDTFREVLDQARSQPTVIVSDPDQPILFGEEFLKPILQRAELAAEVRSGLGKDKRLFGFATKNAEALGEAGNTSIDTAAASALAADANQALRLFDQLKNETGPVADLLNAGAARVAQGESQGAVARQIQREIGDSIERELTRSGIKKAAPTAAPEAATPGARPEFDPETQALLDEIQGIADDLGASAADNARKAQRAYLESADVISDNLPATDQIAPSPRPRPSRDELEAHAIQRAIANGEVRPTEMEPPALPAPPQADLDEVLQELAGMDPTVSPLDQLGDKPATRQALADELRLAAEHAKQDAEAAWAAEQAAREAEGHHLLSLEEKKAQGLGGDWLEPAIEPEVLAADAADPAIPGTPSKTPLADALRDTLRALAESDARLYRGLDETLGNIKEGLNALDAMDGPAPKAKGSRKKLPPETRKALVAAEASDGPAFVLPEGLKKPTRRYGRKELVFQSDLDLAAYIVAGDNPAKPSKVAAQFREALAAAGLDPDQIAAHGAVVKQAVKDGTQQTKGHMSVIPVQQFGGSKPRLPGDEVQRRIEANNQQIDDLNTRSLTEGCDT